MQCSAQIMKQNNHDNSRYCVNSMKNLPANESGCADHHGGGCGCGCVPSGGRASSCGAGRGATPATWTGGGGGRHDLGTCLGADRRLRGEDCGFESESESGDGAIGRAMGHLGRPAVGLRCRHLGFGFGWSGEEDCGCGFVLGGSTTESGIESGYGVLPHRWSRVIPLQHRLRGAVTPWLNYRTDTVPTVENGMARDVLIRVGQTDRPHPADTSTIVRV